MFFCLFSFLFFVLVKSKGLDDETPLCNFAKCTDHIKITAPILPDMVINTGRVDTLLKVMYHRTRKYNSNCEFFFSHQDARDCLFTTSVVDRTIDELKEIEETGKYLLGIICKYPDDCRYDQCVDNSLYNKGEGNREFQVNGTFYRNRFSSKRSQFRCTPCSDIPIKILISLLLIKRALLIKLIQFFFIHP